MSPRPLLLIFAGSSALLLGPVVAHPEPRGEPKEVRGPISIHILDTSIGKPGVGMAVVLEESAGKEWRELARSQTDSQGRINRLWPATGELRAGIYRVRYDSKEYFAQRKVKTFYPRIEVTFEITEPGEHHHIPLLLSPFGYTTYRGS